MELPLSPEELRQLLPSDLISEALEAQYAEDPPAYTLPSGSPFRFGQGELPPLESRIYQYLFHCTESWDRSLTLKLTSELDLTDLAATVRKEINELTGRRQVLIMNSLINQRLADDVCLQVRKLRKTKPTKKSSRPVYDSADKENINPAYFQRY